MKRCCYEVCWVKAAPAQAGKSGNLCGWCECSRLGCKRGCGGDRAEPRGSGAFARFPKIYVGRAETFPEQRAVVGLRPSLKHIELY